VLVLPPKPRVEVIDPDVGQLDRVIDAFEADGAHGKCSIENIGWIEALA
jgi:hypothetical protein